MSGHKMFRYSVLIREHHLDTFKLVNNAMYLALLEEARWEFLHEQGMDLKTIHETGMGPIVLDCHIQFLKELRLRQTIIIESKMISFDKKIGVMQQDMLDGQSKDRCSHAKITFGFFDMSSRKLILPTAQWRIVFGLEC